ncbi:MAG: MarR family transcriptional regulator [Leptospiraceae bacterium]|nr:MarR family transcriptional regulator [Leptospiraceae bacterium]MCK6382067.1 MarR family transcriptional regulator [Leptospiraceae bacterium]NUM42139.1 MarR family transcriptional regulator [Leptospiraceae bacterium]
MSRNLTILTSETMKDIQNRILSQNPKLNKNSIMVSSRALLFTIQLSSLLDSYFQSSGLSQPGFLTLLILNTLCEREWTVLELSEVIRVKPPTMTGILDTLEKEDLVIRKKSSRDRRIVTVELSKSGKKKIRKIGPIHFSNIESAFGKLDEKFFKSQKKIMNKIEGAFLEFSRRGLK